MENRRVSMNRHTNLLQLEEHMYPLVDVTTPNVFRNLFSIFRSTEDCVQRQGCTASYAR